MLKIIRLETKVEPRQTNHYFNTSVMNHTKYAVGIPRFGSLGAALSKPTVPSSYFPLCPWQDPLR